MPEHYDAHSLLLYALCRVGTEPRQSEIGWPGPSEKSLGRIENKNGLHESLVSIEQGTLPLKHQLFLGADLLPSEAGRLSRLSRLSAGE